MVESLKNEECSICLEELELGDVAILNCPIKHQYHYKCIGEWIYSKNNDKYTCPLCVTKYAEVIDIIPSKYTVLILLIVNAIDVWKKAL